MNASKKPVGRAFWTFKIISPTVTFKDHIFTTEKAGDVPGGLRSRTGTG
jgi:hypothetical protein